MIIMTPSRAWRILHARTGTRGTGRRQRRSRWWSWRRRSRGTLMSMVTVTQRWQILYPNTGALVISTFYIFSRSTLLSGRSLSTVLLLGVPVFPFLFYPILSSPIHVHLILSTCIRKTGIALKLFKWSLTALRLPYSKVQSEETLKKLFKGSLRWF